MERLSQGGTLRWVTDPYFVIWGTHLQSKLCGELHFMVPFKGGQAGAAGQAGERLRCCSACGTTRKLLWSHMRLALSSRVWSGLA